jgi:hypothetical protein
MNIARAAQRAKLRLIIPALAVAIAAHLSMISDPGVVTSVILQAVRATT